MRPSLLSLIKIEDIACMLIMLAADLMLIFCFLETGSLLILGGAISITVLYVITLVMIVMERIALAKKETERNNRLLMESLSMKKRWRPRRLRNRLEDGSRRSVGIQSCVTESSHASLSNDDERDSAYRTCRKPLPLADPTPQSPVPFVPTDDRDHSPKPFVHADDGGERNGTDRALQPLLPRVSSDDGGADDKNTYWLEDLQLTNCEKRILADGLWLNDRIINAAMKLMAMEAERKYITVNGFSDVILSSICGYKKNYPAADFIQILNIRNNHWICISNVFSQDESEVTIYDSYQALSAKDKIREICYPVNVLEAACSFLQLCESDVNMLVAVVQQQEGGDDCGLYAIAFAEMLLQKKDPVLFRIKQSVMRESLISCLQTRHISKFVNSIIDGPTGIAKNSTLYQWASPQTRKSNIGTGGPRRKPTKAKLVVECESSRRRSRGIKDCLEMKSIREFSVEPYRKIMDQAVSGVEL